MNKIATARSILDNGNHWIKYMMRNGNHVCLVGALRQAGAEAEDGAYPLVASVIAEQYPERVHTDREGSSLSEFNDHPDTTWPDIDTVLEKAAVKLDETI